MLRFHEVFERMMENSFASQRFLTELIKQQQQRGSRFMPGPLPPFQPPVNPFRVFYMLTGVTFFAFVSGFSACLFDLNQVKECVDYAEHARDVMQKAGDHMLEWFVAVCKEVFRRYPGR